MSYSINGFKVENTTKIKFKANPKRPGFKAHARYESYSKSKTIGDYLKNADKKYSKADLRYDEEHGHLIILDAKGKQINIHEDK